MHILTIWSRHLAGGDRRLLSGAQAVLGLPATPPARMRAPWPPCHPARQSEGPLGHLATPPARARGLLATLPPRPPQRGPSGQLPGHPALRNGISTKREHNSHFSPLRKPIVGESGAWPGGFASRKRVPAKRWMPRMFLANRPVVPSAGK